MNRLKVLHKPARPVSHLDTGHALFAPIYSFCHFSSRFRTPNCHYSLRFFNKNCQFGFSFWIIEFQFFLSFFFCQIISFLVSLIVFCLFLCFKVLFYVLFLIVSSYKMSFVSFEVYIIPLAFFQFQLLVN